MGIGKERNLGSVPARDLTEELYARLRETHPDFGSYFLKRMIPDQAFDLSADDLQAFSDVAARWLDAELAEMADELSSRYVPSYQDAMRMLDINSRRKRS